MKSNKIRELSTAIAVSPFAMLAFYFSTNASLHDLDYTARIASALLHGDLGLRETPPDWLNEIVPQGDRYYSAFPLGAVLSMAPVALLQKAGRIHKSLQREPPFVGADRHPYDYPSLYSNDFSEVFLPVPWCSPWLIFGALMGIACLIRRNGANVFERGTALAFFAQFLCIPSFFLLAQRYSADLYPFLIFCLLMFLRSGREALLRWHPVMIGLIAISVVVNSLATVSWLVNADQNVPPETRATWEKLLGRRSLEK